LKILVTEDSDQLAEYVRRWKETGPLLDALRDEDIRSADTAASIRMFDVAYRLAVRDLPLRESSGLVQWQDAMRRWRERG
jgi:hypothetical protein